MLTEREEQEERWTRHHRFDIDLLSERLVGATRWVRQVPQVAAARWPLGYFGASTGGAAAIVAAARSVASEEHDAVRAVVSRGGRPDLAGNAALQALTAPTLLLVGGLDTAVIELNRAAYAQMTHCAAKRLHVVPGATHLFEEPGTLEQVSDLACRWFLEHLQAPTVTL